MKLIALTLFNAFCCALNSQAQQRSAGADIEHCSNHESLSPNKKYAVTYGQDRALGFVYEIIESKTRRVLLKLQSSYQRPEATDEWKKGNTGSAKAYWSDDSRYLAIEEFNFHWSGTVIAARISPDGKTMPLPIPLKEILDATRERWDLARLWVDHPVWTDEGTLHLIVTGKAMLDKTNLKNTEHKPGDTSYGVTLKLSQDNTFRVASVTP